MSTMSEQMYSARLSPLSRCLLVWALPSFGLWTLPSWCALAAWQIDRSVVHPAAARFALVQGTKRCSSEQAFQATDTVV